MRKYLTALNIFQVPDYVLNNRPKNQLLLTIVLAQPYYFKFQFDNLKRNCETQIFKCLGNILHQFIK